MKKLSKLIFFIKHEINDIKLILQKKKVINPLYAFKYLLYIPLVIIGLTLITTIILVYTFFKAYWSSFIERDNARTHNAYSKYERKKPIKKSRV